MLPSRDTRRLTHSDTRGSILISLLLVMCLTVLTFSSMIVGSIEWSLANNSLRQAQALALAESGIEHAMLEITAADADLDGLLAGTDGKPNTGDDGLIIGSSPISIGNSGGVYTVLLTDNDDGDTNTSIDLDGRYHLLATGTIRGVTQTVRLVLENGPDGVWSARYGILTNNSLRLEKNVELIGAASEAFSNGSVQISNHRIDGGAWAKYKFDIRVDKPLIQGTVLDNQQVVDYEVGHDQQATQKVPVIDPVEYAKYADYTLSRDGKIYRPDGTVEFDTAGGVAWGNWQYKGKGNWELNGPENMDEGAFYVEGSVKVRGSGGTVLDPIELSLFAEGSVALDGDFHMTAKFAGLTAVAGGDVLVKGKSSYRGSLLAREQLRMEGTSTLRGVVVVEDAVNNFGLVGRKGGTIIKDNVIIWPDAETSLPMAQARGSLLVLEWREEH